MGIRFRVISYLALLSFGLLSGIVAGFDWEVYGWWIFVTTIATIYEVILKFKK